jgi:hypothetical protein
MYGSDLDISCAKRAAQALILRSGASSAELIPQDFGVHPKGKYASQVVFECSH